MKSKTLDQEKTKSKNSVSKFYKYLLFNLFFRKILFANLLFITGLIFLLQNNTQAEYSAKTEIEFEIQKSIGAPKQLSNSISYGQKDTNQIHQPLATSGNNSILIKNTWVRQPAFPNARVLAGYTFIENTFNVPITLEKVISPSFKKIEFHKILTQDGVVSMKAINSVTIPANSSFAFLPGELHLMMIDPEMIFNIGNHIELNFIFSSNIKSHKIYKIKINARVKKK